MKNINIQHPKFLKKIDLKSFLISKILVLFSFLVTNFSYSQISGNSVYQNKNSYERNPINSSRPSCIITDSTFQINVKILLNESADQFKIVLGVKQEAETSKKAIENINSRIKNFVKSLSNLQISEKDYYVDFISQSKIYDYEIDDNKRIVSQKTTGFEVKKNVIIMTNIYQKIDEIISKASEFGIWDIIKVDYLNQNLEKIKQQLFDEAYKIQAGKKEMYQKMLKLEIINHPKIYETFDAFYPKNQYQEYTASESAAIDISYYNNNYINKQERKSKTFFYEGIDESDFDKIIYANSPEIGIQYTLSFSITYDIQKNKK